MSTTRLAVLALLPLVLLAGCRREDIRTFTVEILGLTEASKPKVVEALSKYAGIQKDSYVWDFAKKTLTLRYDSMQLAETNVRHAIAAKGIAVTYPAKADDRAGH